CQYGGATSCGSLASRPRGDEPRRTRRGGSGDAARRATSMGAAGGRTRVNDGTGTQTPTARGGADVARPRSLLTASAVRRGADVGAYPAPRRRDGAAVAAGRAATATRLTWSVEALDADEAEGPGATEVVAVAHGGGGADELGVEPLEIVDDEDGTQ